MSRSAACNPSPVEALPCGSRSTSSVRQPVAAMAVAMLMAVVVLPTPPFWLAIAMPIMRMPGPPFADENSRVRIGYRLFHVEHLPESLQAVLTIHRAAERPFGNSQTVARVEKRADKSSSLASGAKARAEITPASQAFHTFERDDPSTRQLFEPEFADARVQATRPCACAIRPGSSGMSGRSERHTKPGNPAPVPRSSHGDLFHVEHGPEVAGCRRCAAARCGRDWPWR